MAGRWAAVCLLVAAGPVQVVGDEPVRFSFKGWISVPQGFGSEFVRDTTVVLDGGAHVGFLSSDFKFEIQDLPSASYTLEVHNANYEFPILRVDVSNKFTGGVRVTMPDLVTGQYTSRLPYDPNHGLQLQPIRAMDYFEKRESWSILSILMNPMLLMMLFPMIMMYMMPKMMDGMGEEEKAEFMKQQAQMQPQAQMPDLASWLAGSTTDKNKPKKKKN